jgi:hypothetical protein
MDYSLLVAYEVVLFMETLPRREQKRLRDKFVAITQWPSKYVDYSETNPSGPSLGAHVFGRYAIKFWEDFADRHLKILDVKLADH